MFRAKRGVVILLATGLAATSCRSQSTNFNSSSKPSKAQQQPTQQAPQQQAPVQPQPPPTAAPEVSQNVPEKAVTKGSFSAWTEPFDPKPGKDYDIVIEVRLPDGTSGYKKSDLSGQLIGTDGYEQEIGEFPEPVEEFSVQGTKAQLRIEVPGAQKKVRDVIQIRSKLLKEEQSLEIVF
ncbi:MAG: hypothetical protein AB7T49_12365 [Oligoflexales bacterium]